MRFGWIPVVGALALTSFALLRPAAPAVGSVVDYRFSSPPVSAMGITSLAELRGKPVLVDFLGYTLTRLRWGGAAPTVIKHQRELGDDIQVIFVERQGADRDTYEAFAWKMKWMGNAAMWTDERPFPTTGTGLPETALIGVNGELLLQGHPGDLGKQLNEAIEAEIKKSKQAPEGAPAELKKAWSLFFKGEIAAALAECDKLATPEAAETKVQFSARAKAKLERLKRLIDEGYLAEADKLASELAKSLKGAAELSTQLAEQSARIADPSLANEREASKALDAALDKVALDKPFEPGNVKKIAALAEKFAGTKSAERAAHFVALSKRKI